MSLMIGIDTGGTYTDAVLYDNEKGIVSASKSLTTKNNLYEGIKNAVESVLDKTSPSDIKLVSLSTTLATNAVVENHGRSACLILIGYSKSLFENSDLKSHIASDYYYFVDGGHKADGSEIQSLDVEKIKKIVNMHKTNVSSFAICAIFATRNNSHEILARKIIRESSDIATTLSSELADKLDAPKRALTALLNARLISISYNLIQSVHKFLEYKKIICPLMIVRGDGSLMSYKEALIRPIETIMSGPAASIIGAQYLENFENGYVVDIGGTTTDIAIVKDGHPILSPDGTSIGDLHTMVESLYVFTVGIGGDSEVRSNENNMLELGPRRVLPISFLAMNNIEIKETLKKQLNRDARKTYDCMFAALQQDANLDELSNSEQYIYDVVKDGPKSLEYLFSLGIRPIILQNLVNKGILIYSGFTPTDACHVLDLQTTWDKETAVIAAKIWAYKERTQNHTWAKDEIDFSNKVIKQLIIQSAESIFATAYIQKNNVNILKNENKNLRKIINETFELNYLKTCGLDEDCENTNDYRFKIEITSPIIAIGASAPTYYPKIASLLNTDCTIPSYSYAANAIGAVVGKITNRTDVLITRLENDLYRVHFANNPDFSELNDALNFAENAAEKNSRDIVLKNNATNIQTSIKKYEKVVSTNGINIFIETRISAYSSGDPKI